MIYSTILTADSPYSALYLTFTTETNFIPHPQQKSTIYILTQSVGTLRHNEQRGGKSLLANRTASGLKIYCCLLIV